MGRRGLTIDEVRDAVKTLNETNQNVTTLAVHKLLGKGSMSTIQNLLKQLNDEQDEQHRIQRDIPDELKTTSEALLNKVWSIAESIASSDIELLRKSATAEITRLTKEQEEFCESYDKMEEEYNICKEKLKTSLMRSNELERALTETTSAKTALESQYKALIESFSQNTKMIESMMASFQEQDNRKQVKSKDD